MKFDFSVETVKGESGHIGEALGVTAEMMETWFSEIAGKMFGAQMPEGHEGEPKSVSTDTLLEFIKGHEFGAKFLVVSGLSHFLGKYQYALNQYARALSKAETGENQALEEKKVE